MRRRRRGASSRFYLLAVAMTLGALVVALIALAATAALAYLDSICCRSTPALVIAGKVVGYIC